MRSNITCSRRAVLLSAASLAAFTAPASAAIMTWDGEGDANWQTAANWDTNQAPLAGDSLIFQGNAGLANTNDFPAGTPFAGLSFAPNAGAFTLSGNNITLSGNISNNSINPQTVNLGLALESPTTTITGSTTAGAVLALGSLTAPTSSGGAASFVPNAGTITTTSSNSHGILGGWATIGNTTNNVDWATVAGGNQLVAYLVYTDVPAGGTIASDPTTNIRMLGAANLGGASADINTLKSSATGGTGGNDVTNIGADNTLRFGAMGGILNDTGVGNNMRIGGNAGNTGVGNVTAGGPDPDSPGMLVLNASATGSTHANVIGILSTITDNGAGAVTVVKTGLASSYFQSANSYSGGTYINQGHIQGNIGTSFGTGPIHVAPGGHAFLNATSTFANPLFISGTGLPTDNTGALRFSNATITGTITLEGNSRVNVNGNTTAQILSPVTGPHSLEFYGNGGANAQPNLVISEPTNDWGGHTSVISHTGNANVLTATLRLGASEVIPHGTDAGDVFLAATPASPNARARIDLNGFDETVNGLNSPLGSRFEITSLNTGIPVTLTLGENDAHGDFGGSIVDTGFDGAISLVKNGSGTQFIRGGTSSYYGTTTVNGGRLEFVGLLLADDTITVESGATFASNSSVLGDVVVNDGGRIASTGVEGGSMDISGLSLGSGTEIDVNMASFGDPLVVFGSIDPSGPAESVTINVAGSITSAGEYPLISYGDSLGGIGFPAFTLGTLPPRTTATLIHNAASNTLSLNVTSAGDFPVWTGALSSEWSTAILGLPKNWVLDSNPAMPIDFLDGDSVLFPEGAAENTVEIDVTDVAPSIATFENETATYLVTGTRGIVGPGMVVKEGAGTTIIATQNSYGGGTLIYDGILQVGDGGTSGNLGAGLVENHALLNFNRSDDFTIANVIDGIGEIRKTGDGVLTLSGNSLYSGDTTVSTGVIRVTNSLSLGALPGGVVEVSDGSAIDISGNPGTNTQNFGGKQFNISGNGPTGTGALVNAGAVTQLNAFQQIALDADASVGGTGRMDLRGGGNVLNLNGYTLRKRGPAQFTLVGTTVINGGAILVEEGTFAMETTTTTEGDGTVTFEPGTHAQFYQNVITNGGVTWPLTFRDNVAIGNAGGVPATVPANIILEGDVVLVPFMAGVRSPASNFTLILTGAISESGGPRSITKIGVNTVTLGGIGSDYTGPTQIEAGTLLVDGSIVSSPFTLAADATLGGSGTIGGAVAASGIVSPGTGLDIGTLTTGTATFSGTASLAIQIDSFLETSDKLAVVGPLDLGGALLNLSDLGAALLPAETKLVIASYSSLTGVFSNAPDGAILAVGPNSFTISYSETVLGETSITLTAIGGSAYDDWASQMGLDASNNGRLDDPDNDGRPNIVEFALDGDPLDPADDGKTRFGIADTDPGEGVDSAFTLTIPVRDGAVFSGPGDLVSTPVDLLVYSIQGAAELLDFTTLDVAEVTPALDDGLPALSAGWSYRTFRLPGSPGNPHPKAFLRVGISDAAP